MSSAKPMFQYEQIACAIEDEILQGRFRTGDRLPSERQLRERFQVQRNTIRQALELLAQGGHISTEGRRGSFVAAREPRPAFGSVLVNIAPGSGPNGAALLAGIVEGAKAAGLAIDHTNTEPRPDSSMNRVPDAESVPPGTVGAILWPHHPTDTDELRRLNEKLPVVLVDHRVSGVEIDCVRFDDVAGGMIVTEHLLRLGHRKIAFLTDEVFADSVQARWCGYVLAHERAGIQVDPCLGLMYHFIDPNILTLTLRYLMSDSQTSPTAVVCSNDLVAFSLLRLLSMEGLRVPKDVAVTGYGNSTPEYGNAISLTTVDQPFYHMGLEASRVIAERIHRTGKDRLSAPLDICLPVNLVARGSA